MKDALNSPSDKDTTYLDETYYCDFSHPIIQNKASAFKVYENDKLGSYPNEFIMMKERTLRHSWSAALW